MSLLSGTTALPPLTGRAGSPAFQTMQRPENRALTARPVEPAMRPSGPAPARGYAPGAAAREKIEAAVRSAFLHGLVRGAEKLASVTALDRAAEAQGRAAPQPFLVDEIIARLSVQAVRLPVLPEPATPARDAFAEAVLAMRSGLKRSVEGAFAGAA